MSNELKQREYHGKFDKGSGTKDLVIRKICL
jgi:hypothetical protein